VAAYFIVSYQEITDPHLLAEYRHGVDATLERYGGRFLVRGGTSQTIEGDWATPRLVVIEFDDAERFQRWYHSPEYTRIRPLRLQASTARAIVVQGV